MLHRYLANAAAVGIWIGTDSPQHLAAGESV